MTDFRADKERFFALAKQFRETIDPDERERIKEELVQMTFGTATPKSESRDV